ncbi:MAG TPA: hypothetical protein VFW89_03110 [Gemmatimonadaceae bacterium]|nr:hypothetical protein [Gemmatimonadaceae bacterium]
MTVPLYGLAGAGLLVALGCRSGAPSSASGAEHSAAVVTAAPADTVATGTVRIVGAEPATTVILVSDSGDVVLTGALTRELATLDGAHVEVQGSTAPASPPLGRIRRAIAVRSYQILDIGGQQPVVGILAVNESGGFRIDTISLGSVPARFSRLVGAKLWVVGVRDSTGALGVAAYGVLAVARPE